MSLAAASGPVGRKIDRMIEAGGRWISKRLPPEHAAFAAEHLGPHKEACSRAIRLTIASGLANAGRLVAVGVAASLLVRPSTLFSGSKVAALLAAGGATLALNSSYLRLNAAARVEWSKVGLEIQHRIRVKAYERVQQLKLAQFHTNDDGSSLSQLSQDIDRLEGLVNGSWQLLRIGAHSAATAGALVAVAPRVMWLALLPLPVIVWLSLRHQKELRESHGTRAEQAATLGARISGNVAGIETIKSFTIETNELDRVESHSRAYRDSSQSAAQLNARFNYVIEGTLMAGIVGANLLGAYVMARNGLSVGHHASYVMLAGNTLYMFPYIGETLDEIQRGAAALTRVRALLESAVESDEGTVELDPSAVRGDLRFEKVSFDYSAAEGGEALFDDLSLELPSGTMTALVGLTGSGKSSLVSLLMRFYAPTRGRIELDGHDISDLRISQLRRAIAVVHQDIFLFNDTIAANLRLGKADATMEELREAARIARADEFIERLPDGYDTMLGPRGLTLSGGQRQRLAIARAVLKGSRILIFDEATSSLDAETEADIQQAIRSHFADRTIINISHRLASIKHADRIYVLARGGVVQQGTHAELVGLEGPYRSFWWRQSSTEGTSTNMTRSSSRDGVHDPSVQVSFVLEPAGLAADHPVQAKLAARHTGHGPVLDDDELAAYVAPRADAIAAVEAFAAAAGLKVVGRSRLRRELVLEGSAYAIEDAFGGSRAQQGPGVATARALPEPLVGKVRTILGLDRRGLQRPELHDHMPEGSRLWPTQVAEHYGFPPGVDGRGRRIAVVELGGGFYAEDVAAYMAAMRLPPPNITCISVDGATNSPLDRATIHAILDDLDAGVPKPEIQRKYGEKFQDFADTAEATMDVELVAALAPGASIDVYFAKWDELEGLHRALQAIVEQPPELRPDSISVSWGGVECEVAPSIMQAIDQDIELACLRGITVCCASGDYGSLDFPLGKEPRQQANADFPGSSPWALACGGTTLVLADAGIDGQIAWNSVSNGQRMATGGGMSGFFRRPGYQRDLVTPPVGNTWIQEGEVRSTFSGRWLPDVASSADPNVAYHVILAGRAFAGFGTSAAAPLWASAVAIMVKVLGRPLGWINPRLYGARKPRGLTDIDVGNNQISPNPSIPYYRAGRGWDPCTGFGTPRVIELIEWLRDEPDAP